MDNFIETFSFFVWLFNLILTILGIHFLLFLFFWFVFFFQLTLPFCEVCAMTKTCVSRLKIHATIIALLPNWKQRCSLFYWSQNRFNEMRAKEIFLFICLKYYFFHLCFFFHIKSNAQMPKALFATSNSFKNHLKYHIDTSFFFGPHVQQNWRVNITSKDW